MNNSQIEVFGHTFEYNDHTIHGKAVCINCKTTLSLFKDDSFNQSYIIAGIINQFDSQMCANGKPWYTKAIQSSEFPAILPPRPYQQTSHLIPGYFFTELTEDDYVLLKISGFFAWQYDANEKSWILITATEDQ